MRKFISGILVVLGFLTLFFIDWHQTNHWRSKKASELNSALQLCTIHLENSISNRFDALGSLASLFVLHPDTTPEEFSIFASSLLKFHPPIRALQYADSMTRVTFVYPPKGNTVTIDNPMTLLTDPERGPFARKAIQDKRAVLQGPFELRQKGIGIVLRFPIFKETQFLGLSIGVYDLDDLIKETLQGLNLDRFAFKIGDEDRNIFWGSGELSENYQHRIISIADKKWTIYGAWIKAESPPLFPRVLIWLFGLGFVFSSAFSLHFFWKHEQRLEAVVKKRTQDLYKAEEKYRLAMEATADGIWDWDFKTETVYYSQSWSDILSEETVPPLYESWASKIHPDDKPAVFSSLQEHLNGKTTHWQKEHRLRTKKGQWKWVLGRGRVVENTAEGDPARMVGTMTDISEQKQAERALKESERKYRLLADNVSDVIFVIDMDLNYTYLSPSVKGLRGYDPKDLLGKPSSQTLTPSSWKLATQTLADILEHHKYANNESRMQQTLELEMVRKDGSTVWTEVQFSFILNEDKQPAGILGVTRDINERKRSEKLLRESEARFKALHNASFGGIAIHDKGLILDCNQGLSKMTGYSESELVGMDGLRLIAEKSRDFVMKQILSDYEKPYEAMGLRKNKEEYPIRLEARNIPYKGKTVRTVEFRDITESKLAQQEHEKLTTQLIQAQKMESIGRLAGGVAHDFNNMLSIILGNTEILLEDLDSSNPSISSLYEIKMATERSSNLTRQLLAFARKQTIAPKVVDLNETIAGMIQMLKRLIGEDVDLSWKPDTDLWVLKIDPSQIDQILANLCVNAKDSIKGVGKITIETHNAAFDRQDCLNHSDFIPGEYLLMAVSDNGCGMGRQVLDKLFEPFFTTKNLGKGTGLGLATVYGIVKQNKGFINVYSEIDKGTTVRIYLPRHTGIGAKKKRVMTEEIAMGSHETILLVEDETAILAMTTIMLERLGYKVLSASTPEEALRIHKTVSAGDIHLLMTDVVMPGMNGRDLSKKLLDRDPKLKCLFMSGYTANVVAHHGILDEGLNFINKPFSKKDLSNQLRKILA